MSINLILDDVRDAGACFLASGNHIYMNLDWIVVKSYEEFVYFIQTHPMPDRISFDHDLADQHYENGADHGWKGFNYESVTEKTGYHAVLWLIEKCMDAKLPLPECYCHSMNPYGKLKILSAIQQFNRHSN